jgi:hypothetical protein
MPPADPKRRITVMWQHDAQLRSFLGSNKSHPLPIEPSRAESMQALSNPPSTFLRLIETYGAESLSRQRRGRIVAVPTC